MRSLTDELTSKTFSYSATVSNLENLSVSYTYNLDGSRSGMTVPMGSGTSGSFTYGYDDLGRMASLTSPMGDETDWLYHTNDWLSSQYDFDGSSASGTPILKDSYSYANDARGLVSRLFDANSTGGHIAEFGSTSSPASPASPMTYDAAGNRTSMYVSDIANPNYSGTTSYTLRLQGRADAGGDHPERQARRTTSPTMWRATSRPTGMLLSRRRTPTTS